MKKKKTRQQLIVDIFVKDDYAALTCSQICKIIIKKQKLTGNVAHYLSGSISSILNKMVKAKTLQYSTTSKGPKGGYVYTNVFSLLLALTLMFTASAQTTISKLKGLEYDGAQKWYYVLYVLHDTTGLKIMYHKNNRLIVGCGYRVDSTVAVYRELKGWLYKTFTVTYLDQDKQPIKPYTQVITVDCNCTECDIKPKQ